MSLLESSKSHWWEWNLSESGVQATCQECGACLGLVYADNPAERPVQLATFLEEIDAHELQCWGEIIAPWDY